MEASIVTADGGAGGGQKVWRVIARALCLFLIGLWLIPGAAAVTSPFSAEVQPLTLRPRSEAPSIVEIKLHSESRGLLEGTLRLQNLGFGRELFKQEIPDLVIMPGNSIQRILLPPAFREFGSEEIQLQFSTKSGSYDLGRFPLTAASISVARRYVIATCRGSLDGGTTSSLTWRALRPERLLPEARKYYSITPQTSPASIAPEDLPTPLGLCAFDVVILEGGGLAALREQQLADLATWVEAGGSLCVAAPFAIDPEHLAFLNRLAASSSHPTPLLRDPDGKLALSADRENTSAQLPPFFFRRPGLGRFVLTSQAPTDEGATDEPGWRKATHFLAHSNSEEPVDPQAFDVSVAVYRTALVERLLMENLPKTARIIPLPLLLTVFTVFIVMAGPGEWFVLGWLRRRRWTWLTFPLLALGCTLFMVRAAEHYLGTGDQRSSLVITDFSPQGKPLRENRFDLWLAGRNQDAVTEAKQSLVIPCWTEQYSYPRRAYSSSAAYSRFAPSAASIVPLYQGRVPTHYTLRRALTQWTPYVQRSLTFTPKSDASRLRWEALKEEPAHPAGIVSMKQSSAAEKYISETIGAQGWKVRVLPSHFGTSGAPDCVEALTLDLGLPWVTAFSPAARADLLDVMLDHTDEDWIVVATRQEGQVIYMQRCVYHFHSDE